jgi:hypothetical protein
MEPPSPSSPSRRSPPAVGWSLGVVVGLAILVNVGNNIASDVEGHSWDSAWGKRQRADFIVGCDARAAGRVDCGCLWDRLIVQPQYDTPDEMASNLLQPLQRALARGDRGYMPPGYGPILEQCRRS